MTEITKQKTIALSLLVYLTTKDGSTFTDDYYHHLKTQGYSAFDIEMTVERLINSGEIIYLGNDKYWIQITTKGENLIAPQKSIQPYNWKKALEVIAYITGIISALIAIFQLVL